MLMVIGKVERFHIAGALEDRLRLGWTQWLAAQQRLRDERGF
jgi:hypothetical protein